MASLHDRTRLLYEGDLPHSVEINPAGDPRDSGVQASLVIAAATSGRFADVVYLPVEDIPYHHPGPDQLRTVLRHHVEAIGAEYRNEVPDVHPDGRITIGEDELHDRLSLGFTDDGVIISDSEPTPCEGDPIAGVLAGGIASWGLFLMGTGHEIPLGSSGTTSFDLPPTEGIADLSSILLIGAGGVGSNVAFLLPLLGFEGRVDIVDPDHISPSNLNRCLPYRQEHVTGSTHHKAPTLADYLRNRGVEAQGHTIRFRDFAEDERPDHALWLMLANEGGVWNEVQHNFPPRVASGATSPEWNVQGTRHHPIEDPCVACFWGVHDDPIADFGCAGVGGNEASNDGTEEEREQGVLPFMGPLAGALSVIQAGVPQGQPNWIKLHLTRKNLATEALNLPRREDCICQPQDATVYRSLMGESDSRTEGGG